MYFCQFRSWLFLGLMALSHGVCAQQEPKLNQFMFGEIFYNPGATGSVSAISTIIASRYQWVNIPGDASPRTSWLSVHSPIQFLKGGVGLLVIQDQEYFNKSNNVRLNYAFRIPLSYVNFGFGLYGGLIQSSLDGSKFRPENPNDPLLVGSNVQATTFDIGAGFNIESTNFFLNIAANHLNKPKLQFNNTGSAISYAMNVFASTGYRFRIGQYFQLIPSVLYKTNSSVSQIDGNIRLSVAERLWIGGGYSQGDGILGFLGFRMFKGLRFGYSYTSHLGQIGQITAGTHEAFLSYNLRLSLPDKPYGKTLTPRYF